MKSKIRGQSPKHQNSFKVSKSHINHIKTFLFKPVNSQGVLRTTNLQKNTKSSVKSQYSWLHNNHLVLNTRKYEFTGFRINKIDCFTYNLVHFQRGMSQNLLGTTIDELLYFQEHIANVCKSVRQTKFTCIKKY